MTECEIAAHLDGRAQADGKAVNQRGIGAAEEAVGLLLRRNRQFGLPRPGRDAVGGLDLLLEFRRRVTAGRPKRRWIAAESRLSKSS